MSWSGGGAAAGTARLERDVVGAIALPARRAAASAALVEQARAAGLGVVLAAQTWLNQLPPERRPRGFAALPYAQGAALDLERQAPSPRPPARAGREALSSAAAAAYADAVLDAQLAAGATLVTTPAHVCSGELGAGRDADLQLAEASVAAWRERQGWRPPPQRRDEPPRELHAALAVRPRDLPAAVGALIARYAALPVDGYWLTLVDDPRPHPPPAAASAAAATDRPLGSPPAAASAAAATDRPLGRECADAAAVAAVAELALGLQEATGRPVTVGGAGSLAPALLASGVAAVCVGATDGRPAFPPRPLDADGVTGIALPVYHPAIVGFVPAGAAHDEARDALFAATPCRCGAHRSFEPPRGRRATSDHNRWCLAAEARDATRLVPPLDEARLAARAARAERTRRRLGLPPLPSAWQAVAAVAQARRADRATALA